MSRNSLLLFFLSPWLVKTTISLPYCCLNNIGDADTLSISLRGTRYRTISGTLWAGGARSRYGRAYFHLDRRKCWRECWRERLRVRRRRVGRRRIPWSCCRWRWHWRRRSAKESVQSVPASPVLEFFLSQTRPVLHASQTAARWWRADRRVAVGASPDPARLATSLEVGAYIGEQLLVCKKALLDCLAGRRLLLVALYWNGSRVISCKLGSFTRDDGDEEGYKTTTGDRDVSPSIDRLQSTYAGRCVLVMPRQNKEQGRPEHVLRQERVCSIREARVRPPDEQGRLDRCMSALFYGHVSHTGRACWRQVVPVK